MGNTGCSLTIRSVTNVFCGQFNSTNTEKSSVIDMTRTRRNRGMGLDWMNEETYIYEVEYLDTERLISSVYTYPLNLCFNFSSIVSRI